MRTLVPAESTSESGCTSRMNFPSDFRNALGPILVPQFTRLWSFRRHQERSNFKSLASKCIDCKTLHTEMFFCIHVCALRSKRATKLIAVRLISMPITMTNKVKLKAIFAFKKHTTKCTLSKFQNGKCIFREPS